MKRFVGAFLDDFERLFADPSLRVIERADYPPCCQGEFGPLRFRPVKAGGVVVEVRRCDAEPTGDFRLDVLFKTGSSPFGDAVDLARFWNSAVADAFALPRGPLPERAQQSLLDDLQVRITEAPQRAGSRAAAPNRAPAAAVVAERLAVVVRGQPAPLRNLSELVVSQLAKRSPQRPATALLLGPTGVGKTATVEALPAALAAAGWRGAHVHRINCNELTDDYDVHRFLGSAPGLVGYTKTPPLISALKQSGCIVLLDEVDKAHPAVQEALYSLLDTGRIMSPDGKTVSAPDAIIAMTSAVGADELDARFHQVDPDNRWALDRGARAHLKEHHWPGELLGRIDTIAVFRRLDGNALREAAADAIRSLAAEYGFSVQALPLVLADVVVDLADSPEFGARALHFGARQLLADLFASAVREGVEPSVMLDAGPPPTLVPAG